MVSEFNFCCNLSLLPPSHGFPLISGFSGSAWDCTESRRPTLEGSASAFYGHETVSYAEMVLSQTQA